MHSYSHFHVKKYSNGNMFKQAAFCWLPTERMFWIGSRSAFSFILHIMTAVYLNLETSGKLTWTKLPQCHWWMVVLKILLFFFLNLKMNEKLKWLFRRGVPLSYLPIFCRHQKAGKKLVLFVIPLNTYLVYTMKRKMGWPNLT